MRAILYKEYGPPETLQYAEVEQPAPTEKQILVKVRAASINALEWRPFTMSPLLLRLMGGGSGKPRNPKMGTDVAGTVETVGSAVTDFRPGDEVFGTAPGSFAEYACNGESRFVLKPANVSFEAAASIPVAACTALQGLRDKGQIQPGQKVLIDGASGGVGVFAVQIAKSYGAEVTAVCGARNLEMARSLGADHLIDYRREDFTRRGEQYDLILAVNGHHAMRDYGRALRPTGVCVVVGGPLLQVLQVAVLGRLISRPAGKKHVFFVAATPQKDLLVLRDLLEAGKLAPVIDKTYPLGKAAEAIRYVMDEHARGKVVITVSQQA